MQRFRKSGGRPWKKGWMMSEYERLTEAFEQLNSIAQLQAEVISELFGLLSQHIAADELDGLHAVRMINLAADLRKDIEWPEGK